MKSEDTDSYYARSRRKLLKSFDKRAGAARRILTSRYGAELADTILREARQGYEALIPHLPHVGDKNLFLGNLIQSAAALALYRVLKSYGKTVEEAGKILYDLVEEHVHRYPRFLLRRIARLRFSAHRLKKHAAESQEHRHPESWVFTFVEDGGEEGQKEFDFGLDFTECAICKFFHAQGADEFTPYVCLIDFAMSRACNMGMVRTMTLAEGHAKCDFRYMRGRETGPGWPPAFAGRDRDGQPRSPHVAAAVEEG